MAVVTSKTYTNTVIYWWLILFSGFVLVGLGVWVLLSPFESYLSLSVAFAFGILVTGFFEVFFSIANYKHLATWGLTLFGGLVDIAVGSYLLFYPLITMAILRLIVGFWILFRGMFAIGHSIGMRSRSFWEWGWLLLSGIFIVFFALMILGYPSFGIVNIILWTGLAFICAGIFRIYLSIKFRQIKNIRGR
ncbi:HdeD family acid-resistance protein [Mucilaginibacter xinganensis]|uniref:HdeD family acid-resistance protein n=1 Tax=Mucilaginibacter xinganensis TaxID=1234841 RepID=A0A223NY29_9SPHI|nr:DUF308 domain-containing protein [Mucilaginibacter xinganensis]ASU34765.1 hypothetical protein MuYL_2878 [Mucilaginibacter xinganensis]